MTARYPVVLNGTALQEVQSGDTVTGLTSGYTFTFANYLDSRLFDNVEGAASYGPANSY